jgi:hypothetical protein
MGSKITFQRLLTRYKSQTACEPLGHEMTRFPQLVLVGFGSKVFGNQFSRRNAGNCNGPFYHGDNDLEDM